MAEITCEGSTAGLFVGVQSQVAARLTARRYFEVIGKAITAFCKGGINL